MSKITDAVTALALPLAEKLGIEIWDVEFLREGGEQYLRIYIDSENGAGIAECEALSRAIDPLLDEADFIATAYILEVSTPGLDRTLKKPEHFARFIGENVELRLYKAVNGSKTHTGALISYGAEIVIFGASGEIAFSATDVSKVKLAPDFAGLF